MSTLSLLDLPPDIAWLIAMPPTRAAIDAYLAPSDTQPVAAPAGAHRQPFTLSNIWAAHSTAPAYERRHAFTVDNERVFGYVSADVSVQDVLPLPAPAQPSKKDIDEEKWFFAGTDDEIARKIYDARCHSWQRHMDRVQWVCHGFSWRLTAMIDQYEGIPPRPYAAPLQLAFDPYVSPLPARELIDALAQDQATAHLMMLVARHELGYIALKVEAWLQSSHRDRRPAHAPFLTDDDWDLLSARQRGHKYIKTGASTDQYGRYRDDAPIDTFQPTSDVSRLYWECSRWAAAIYTKVLAVRPCKLDGCDRLPPQSRGRGRPPEYCCTEHQEEGLRLSRAEAKRRARQRTRPDDARSPQIAKKAVRKG